MICINFSFRTTFFILCTALLLPACNYAISTTEDTDGDGVADTLDKCPDDPKKTEPGDCGCNKDDEDAITINGKKYCFFPENDRDTDRDGVVNDADGCPNTAFKYEPGLCGCEGYDLDQDNDGIVDTCRKTPDKESSAYIEKEDGSKIKFPDQCPDDPNKTKPGICGCGFEDIDNDNDGFIDGCGKNGPQIKIFPDRCPNDPKKQKPGICGCDTPDTDSDGDGTPDCMDNCPNDFDKTEPGICGCGKDEDDTDTDGDGTPDCIDACPNDPGKTKEGICGCGITDDDTDTDGDGTPDCIDACPNDSGKTKEGLCGCGIPDDDTDSDGDYVPDCMDACPNDTHKTEPGICGCDILDNDDDNDGYFFCGEKNSNTQDHCPDDPTRQQPGICGCGSSGWDSEVDIIEENGETRQIQVCIENGGILQAGPTPDTCDETYDNMIMAFNNRRVSTLEVSLFYAPAGNLLTNPFLEQDDDGWRVSQGFGITAEELVSYKPSYAAFCQERPFGMYPVLQTHSEGTTFEQGIKLSACTDSACEQPLTMGMFAVGQAQDSCSDASDAIQISLTGKALSCASDCMLEQEATDKFQFFTLSKGIQLSEEEQEVTLRFASTTACTSPDGDYDGAVLQYFGAWLGEREIRFSNDRIKWTDWELWTPDAWLITDWNLKTSDDDEMSGNQTVYMQTHDLLTDRYYETSSRIIYISPTELP